jgi:hypothetical protein
MIPTDWQQEDEKQTRKFKSAIDPETFSLQILCIMICIFGSSVLAIMILLRKCGYNVLVIVGRRALGVSEHRVRS